VETKIGGGPESGNGKVRRLGFARGKQIVFLGPGKAHDCISDKRGRGNVSVGCGKKQERNTPKKLARSFVAQKRDGGWPVPSHKPPESRENVGKGETTKIDDQKKSHGRGLPSNGRDKPGKKRRPLFSTNPRKSRKKPGQSACLQGGNMREVPTKTKGGKSHMGDQHPSTEKKKEGKK